MNDRRTKRLIWILVAIVLFFLVAAVVQWLWNCIIPWVIGFPPVTYWQAAGLLLLTRILFGGIGRAFAGGCNCGCKTGVKRAEDMPADITHGMSAMQKQEYLARSRAFLDETDDSDI